MKNYFKSEEQAKHLLILLASEMAKELIENRSPTDEEIEVLKRVVESIDKFSQMVFNRLGDGYARSLRNKTKLNTVKICSKCATVHSTEMQDTIDADILRDIIDLYGIECEGCNDTNCTKCNFYKIRSYLGMKGENADNDLCPFRKESEYDKYDL